jgi:hypothetical protein
VFALYGEGPRRLADCASLGALLAALVAADAPALQELKCFDNALGDVGLAPLLAALPLSRHLRGLDISSNNMSEAFARERLLPAVRANTSLRSFACYNGRLSTHQFSAVAEARELLERRSQLRS